MIFKCYILLLIIVLHIFQFNGGTETEEKVPGVTVEPATKPGWSIVKISTAANKFKAGVHAQFKVLTKHLSNFLKRIRLFLSRKSKKYTKNNLQSECKNLNENCYETPIQPKPTVRDKIKKKLKKLNDKNKEWGEKTSRFIKKKRDFLKDKNKEWGEKTYRFIKKKRDFLKDKNKEWGEKTYRFIKKKRDFLNNKNKEWGEKTSRFIKKKRDYIKSKLSSGHNKQ